MATISNKEFYRRVNKLIKEFNTENHRFDEFDDNGLSFICYVNGHYIRLTNSNMCYYMLYENNTSLKTMANYRYFKHALKGVLNGHNQIH